MATRENCCVYQMLNTSVVRRSEQYDWKQARKLAIRCSLMDDRIAVEHDGVVFVDGEEDLGGTLSPAEEWHSIHDE